MGFVDSQFGTTVSKCLCMKIWPLMVKYESTTKRWTSLSISLILHRRSRLVRFLYLKYLHLKFKLAPQKYFVPLTAPSLKNLEPFLLLTFRRPWEWRRCYQFATGIPSILLFLSKYLFQHLPSFRLTVVAIGKFTSAVLWSKTAIFREVYWNIKMPSCLWAPWALILHISTFKRSI